MVLGVLAIALVPAAIWIAARSEPKLDVAWLPIGAGTGIPSVTLFVAAGAVAAAAFLALAALHAAAAMRVLARDRRIPAPLSPQLRKLRRLVLTPLGETAVRLTAEPALPANALPDADTTRPPLRLTVLVPAHDEELTIAGTLASL